MSGDPPHHPHNRPWDFMGMPNWRQPQHAHMAHKHSIIHQSNWHPPTTESMKVLGQIPHNFALHQMFENIALPNAPPGVDLTLAAGHNGDATPVDSPISLSVKDSNNKSAGNKKMSADSSHTNKTPASSNFMNNKQNQLQQQQKTPKFSASGDGEGVNASVLPVNVSETTNQQQQKRATPLDSVLERLKPSYVVSGGDKSSDSCSNSSSRLLGEVSDVAINKPHSSVIIVPPNSSQDESSDSSTLNVPNSRDEDVISPYNTEDSLDSGSKSRRKRKPSKTLRCSKNNEDVNKASSENDSSTNNAPDNGITATGNPIEICLLVTEEKKKEQLATQTGRYSANPRRRSSSSEETNNVVVSAKTRRKTSSESETIDNIAAMVQEGLKEKEQQQQQRLVGEDDVGNDITFVPVSVIKTKGEMGENVCQESVVSESTSKTSSLVTPAQKKETHFVEIENKLEEMFAGIEDSADPLIEDVEDAKTMTSVQDDPLLEDSMVASTSQDNVSSTSNDVMVGIGSSKTQNSKDAAVRNKKINNGKKKKDKDNDQQHQELLTSMVVKSSPKKNARNGNSSSKSKKKKSSDRNNSNIRIGVVKNSNSNSGELSVKEASNDSGSSSNASSSRSRPGPFIHIKGPRNSPMSVNVVNTPLVEEELEKKIKTKKFLDDSEYRHKVRSKGLHCSTLSNKYDAQTKDATWICVFCKRGPHTSEISRVAADAGCGYPSGDLFGPYFINVECEEYDRRLDDPYDKQFRSKKVIRALEAPKTTVPAKKAKRRHLEGDAEASDPYLGIVEASPSNRRSYEIWVHEECLIWSPGVHLVGPRIVGLQEAVWTACNVVCTMCGMKGANVCCLRRGCVKTAHVWCAKKMSWGFDEDCFKTYCDEHDNRVVK